MTSTLRKYVSRRRSITERKRKERRRKTRARGGGGGERMVFGGRRVEAEVRECEIGRLFGRDVAMIGSRQAGRQTQPRGCVGAQENNERRRRRRRRRKRRRRHR